MRLVRTYGSVTINLPVTGGYDEDRIAKRRPLGIEVKEEAAEDEKGSGPLGLWHPKNLIIGFTATGFHYGLVRETEVNRGGAGMENITDYKYSQFFDDIFALSVLYIPYFYIHTGIILNREIEPEDDGTMSYSRAERSSQRMFFASNLLSFLNMNATTTTDELESLSVGVEVNSLAGLLTKIPSYVPKVSIIYKQLNLYNDQPYDAVWVETSAGKSADMPESARGSAMLHTCTLILKENLFNYVFLNAYLEFQKPSKDLVEKRTGSNLDPALMREFYFTAGYNFFGSQQDMSLIASAGVSRYWDPAIPYHRADHDSSDQYVLWGGTGSLVFESAYFGAEIRGSYNFADELKKLVETSDKYILECSLFFRF